MLSGPTTGEIVRADTVQLRAPALASGDVVVMDNLAAHTVVGVREAADAAGATIRSLPASGPDLNPIEQVFARLKALLRKAATRTRAGSWNAVGDLLGRFTPAECRNDPAHCGYRDG